MSLLPPREIDAVSFTPMMTCQCVLSVLKVGTGFLMCGQRMRACLTPELSNYCLESSDPSRAGRSKHGRIV